MATWRLISLASRRHLCRRLSREPSSIPHRPHGTAFFGRPAPTLAPPRIGCILPCLICAGNPEGQISVRLWSSKQAESPGSRSSQDDAQSIEQQVFSWRRGSESNRRIKVLQTLALPLGYRAGRKSYYLEHNAAGRSKSIRNHGQYHAGRMSFVVVEGLERFPQRGFVGDGASGIGVTVEAREVAA
jgi:hypothetical protein